MADSSLALTPYINPMHQPRAFLLGIPDEEIIKLQARMPNLADVRSEAQLAVEIMKGSFLTDVLEIDSSGNRLPPSLARQLMFPNLSTFAYFCREEDVPADLQDICIWMLKLRLEALKQGSAKQLKGFLSDPSGRVDPKAAVFMESQTLCKITNHLLSTRMNAPEEALPYMEACMKLEERLKPGTKDPFLRNPQVYASYGTVLARTKSRDAEAKVVLQRVVDDIEKVSSRIDKKMHFIQAKLYLARVLRRSGELEEAKKCESYLINWFKKNANAVGDRGLRQWFLTESEGDAVFTGLGGMKWLESRKMTWKSMDRSARVCYSCGVRESPTKKMLKCAKCQYTFYCSKECQVKDHPFHKVSCLERAESLKRAKLLKAISPEDGRCAEDWNKYKTYHYDHAVIHALGLKFHPSRGRTHILVRSLKYVPDGGKDVIDRFVIVAAGVFAIDDILAEMDSRLNYNPGESKQVVDELIQDFDQGRDRDKTRIPYFILLISDDARLGAELSRGTLSKQRLLETNYNPNWRSLLNPGKNITVQQVVLRCGVSDAEFDYIQNANSGETAVVSDDSPGSGAENRPSTSVDMSDASTAAILPGLRGMFIKK